MGQLRLTGTMPSGHTGTLMPGRMYFVDDARATLDGADLGQPARWPASPVIGAVPLPARGVLAIGQAVFAPGSRVCRRSLACACGQGCADRALAGLATASTPVPISRITSPT